MMVDTTPQLALLSGQPRLYVLDNFCTPSQVERLLAACPEAETALRDGLQPKDDETGLSYELPVASDPALRTLMDRIAAVSGLSNAIDDTFRYRRYSVGTSHPPHLDEYTIGEHALVATAMVCLQAPTAGGDTVFPVADDGPVRVVPHTGRLALWFNVDETGTADPGALHLATEVLAGEKVTLTAFIYGPASAAATDVPASVANSPQLQAAIGPQKRDESTILRGFGRRFVCVDHGVPEITIATLQRAAWDRGLRFEHLDASRFDFDPSRRLSGGELLYRPATSLASMRVEQHLFHPDCGTFYTTDDSIFWDPVSSSMMFERAGLSIARSIFAHNADRDLLDAWASWLGGFPLVAKVLGGSRGVGVMRVDSTQAYYSLMDFALAQGHTPLLCAFVPDAIHWRVVVVGDRAVAWYKNADEDGDFRTYGSEDPTMYMSELPDGAEALAVAACHVLENAFGGVDILEHPSGRLYLLEANFPCYFAQAQEVAGVDVAGAMVDYLLDQAMQRR